MKKISLSEAEYIAHELAKELFHTFDEPMPDFHTRYAGRLESCLEQPFQTFNGKDLYGKKVIDKAAVLFYLVIKNHPFENGNKRMAVTLMMIFLYKNSYWLNIDAITLYKLALMVAKSPAKDKKVITEVLIDALNEHLVKHSRLTWMRNN